MPGKGGKAPDVKASRVKGHTEHVDLASLHSISLHSTYCNRVVAYLLLCCVQWKKSQSIFSIASDVLISACSIPRKDTVTQWHSKFQLQSLHSRVKRGGRRKERNKRNLIRNISVFSRNSMDHSGWSLQCAMMRIKILGKHQVLILFCFALVLSRELIYLFTCSFVYLLYFNPYPRTFCCCF